MNTANKKTKNSTPALSAAPEGYADWLVELKSRIHNAQQKTALAVKRELI